MDKSFDKIVEKYCLAIWLVIFCSALFITFAANAETAHVEKAKGPVGVQSIVTHQVKAISKDRFTWKEPDIPDTSIYNLQAVRKKIPELKAASISIQRLVRKGPLKEFVGNTRLLTWATRQLSFPKVIKLDNGIATLSQIAKAVDKRYFESLSEGIFISRLPIVVGHSAALLIEGNKERELRLSQDRGAFLVNDGLFFSINTRLVGWNEENNTLSYYKEKKDFRPFFISWGGSETYIANSAIESFGYFNSKSYGITFSQYNEGDHMNRPPPKGWIINSEFVDVFYGFYCYEAEDVVLLANTYRDNILYGIDPHDRSSRLLIANNHIYGARVKHGIILSREVNDSWVVNNRVHDNLLSGIVLDRNSQRNIIANNITYNNGGDGITIYESPNNRLWNNIVLENARQGIRVRNSDNVYLSNNAIARNGGYGIFSQVKDLSDTDRNLSLDPYQAYTQVFTARDTFTNNHNGPISFTPAAATWLYKPNFVFNKGAKSFSLKGELAHYHHKILDILYRKKSAVAIEPTDRILNKNKAGS